MKCCAFLLATAEKPLLLLTYFYKMTGKRRILALSSSRVGNSGYLEKALPLIKDFLGHHPLQIAFVPFAFVNKDTSSLVNSIRQAFSELPHTITEVTMDNGKEVMKDADVIMVSGGNTFKLLHDLYASGLLDVIRQKVNAGAPYIGWSAGSNITGATICTTNDMPIIGPQSFTALGFFPFQINPHYYNVVIEGFNGETRDDRLGEFLQLNPLANVVCLPEGTALLLEKGILKLTGDRAGVIMNKEKTGIQKVEIQPGTDISTLLS
jgi:dipeptidase E